MKPMTKRKVLLLFSTIILVFTLTSIPKAEIDKDSLRAEIHRMIEQADSLSEISQYDSAIVIGNLALEEAEDTFGIEDTTVALALHRLGAYYSEKGEYDKAEPLCRRALKIRQKILGALHSDIASSVNNLATLAHFRGNYAEAESLYKQALAIWEKTVGPEHPDFGKGLYNLGLIEKILGKYADAELIFKRTLKIWEKTVGPEHPLVARSLSSLGILYVNQGKYSEAERLFKQALTIEQNALGSEHPMVAFSFVNLGWLYDIQGKYDKSEPLYKRALAIREKTLGPEHPDVASSLNSLAFLYIKYGKYTDAEPFIKKALAIREKALGPEHPAVAQSLINLGNLYDSQGKYDKAEPLLKRALAIREKSFGPEHPAVAQSLNCLSITYEFQRKYTKAVQLQKRSLAIREKAFGSEDPMVAESIHNLAVLYHLHGKHTEAETLYKRAMAIREKALGSDHLEVAHSLVSLASLYYERCNYTEAEGLFLRALVIEERVFGLEHSDVANSIRNLALLYCSLGEYEKAIINYEKLNESRQNFIDYAFSNASENLKMSYIKMYPLMEHSLFSFAMLEKSKKTIEPALEMALKSKAIIIDAVSAEKEIAYCSYDDELLAKAEKHANICGEIATLALAGAENHEPEIYRERMQTLNNIKDSLETELSRDCSEFKDEMASRRFEVEDVANALPDDGVLWEIVRYEPYDFTKIGSGEDRTGPPRYIAFTLDHAGEITMTDLGDAAEIDSLVTLARKMIYNAGTEIHTVGDVIAETRLNEVTGMLYDIIFAPLESPLGDKTQIFISPDGQLSLLPFEILPDNNGTYAIEKYNISYLSSGRDLLKFKKKPDYGNWALAMAAPDFDFSQKKLTDNRNKTLNKSEHIAFAYEPSRGASGCLNTSFNSLPYTKKETKSVVKTLKKKAKLDVDVYYEDKALEEVLKGMTIAPRVLHLSTHGYFCEDIDLTENKMLENPLLRSGLVLAGANRLMAETEEDTFQVEDGILTAFEVSGLNLTGTELVTLSACETGVGEVQNGEGVYGLRRAFQHAGARTILMSLWKVPDKETHDLMDNFYRNWLSGENKQAALRQAALKVIEDHRKKQGAAHPYYWGAFVMMGDPE